MTLKSKLSNLLKNSYVKTILLAIIIIGSVIAFWYGLRLALATEYPLLTVASGSMRPTLNVGDLILVQGISNFSEVKAAPNPEGDIIIFRRQPSLGQNDLIVHRAISKTQSVDDSWSFRTQGDANPSPDPWTVSQSSVVGKVVGVVPWLGYVPLYIRTPLGLLLIVLLILLVIFTEFIPFSSKKQTNAKD